MGGWQWIRATRRRPLIGYALGLLLPLLALAVRLRFGALLTGFPFLSYFAAVILASLLGGRGPGVVAAILSALLADYYLIEPVGAFMLSWPSGWIAMTFFAVTSAIIVLIVNGQADANEIRAAAQEKLRRLNRALEDRVAERTEALEREASERGKAQAQLRQIQKMEAIGQLTGGIAHDFNNMLAIILGSLDLAERKLGRGDTEGVLRHLKDARDGTERGAKLTDRLLAFSRRRPLAAQLLDINALVRGMSDMLARALGERIHVETHFGAGLWTAFADAAQLESALVNLAVNARDAMPEGGRLIIETANCTVDDGSIRHFSGFAPGDYVKMSVTDTGSGMDHEVLERAFEPFFTTKGVGKGTGLGLSQVYGYVNQCGGYMRIESEPGAGTSVKLYLPRHDGVAAEVERGVAAGSRRGPAIDDRTILIVEDEAGVREMACAAIRELGYLTREAPDADMALDILASDARIDLMLTDMVMPGLNGRELIEKALALRPGLQVIITTGYTDDAQISNGLLDARHQLLFKPFTVEALDAKLRALFKPQEG